MQRYEQESTSEHAGDFDGGREGSKHLTLVPLYRFIGLSVCVLRDSHGRIEC